MSRHELPCSCPSHVGRFHTTYQPGFLSKLLMLIGDGRYTSLRQTKPNGTNSSSDGGNLSRSSFHQCFFPFGIDCNQETVTCTCTPRRPAAPTFSYYACTFPTCWRRARARATDHSKRRIALPTRRWFWLHECKATLAPSQITHSPSQRVHQSKREPCQI